MTEKIFEKIRNHSRLFIFLSKGLKVIINFGNKVKTDIIANNIAIPVNTPK